MYKEGVLYKSVLLAYKEGVLYNWELLVYNIRSTINLANFLGLSDGFGLYRKASWGTGENVIKEKTEKWKKKISKICENMFFYVFDVF